MSKILFYFYASTLYLFYLPLTILAPTTSIQLPTHQWGVNVLYVQQSRVDLVNFLVLHSSLFKVSVGEVEQHVALQDSRDGSLVDATSLVGEQLRGVHILDNNLIWGLRKITCICMVAFSHLRMQVYTNIILWQNYSYVHSI